mgnify:CR=1 FL=1
MRLATKNDINSLSLIRVKEQKEDWNEEFEIGRLILQWHY